MYLSLDWLKDYVDIPKSVTPEDLGLRLTMHTVEIDDVVKQSEKFSNIVVGQIKEISKHPNADRLRLAKVNIGKERLNIVCGAPNIEVGQMVPVALVGCVLPSGLEIKKAEVRGEESCGMLCAEDELGLGDDHAGIMILDKRAKTGQKFNEYLKLKDTVLEVDNKSITHRPDLWGHVGIAREISTFLNINRTARFDKLFKNKIKVDSQAEKIEIKIEDYDLCPRYLAVVMSNIEIKDSPDWLQARLIAVGMRPINSIVDITNYVMLELGQPIHAFDKAKIDKIVVRSAKKGEKITTLDGKERLLESEDLVITDGQKPVAIAGVMGGENSEVANDTKAIVIEVANFNPVSIRKTAQRHDLRTEASIRFEKSLDPNLCAITLARVVELVKELHPQAQVSSAVVDEKRFKLNQGPISLDLDWLDNFVGVKLDEKRVIDILNNLGFETEKKDRVLHVTVPTWRATKDVSIKEDLAEEVARIIGYDNILSKMPAVEMLVPETNQERKLERRIKNILSLGAKLTECYNYSFVDTEQLEKMGINYSQYIRLANPIASNQTVLRQTLATNLFNNIKTNQARFEEIKMFEIGSVYLSHQGELSKDSQGEEKLPYQEKRAGIVLAYTKNKELFREMKGVIEYFGQSLNLNFDFIVNEAVPYWADKSEAAQIKFHDKIIGTILKLDKSTKAKLGIKKEVAIAEISLKELFMIFQAQTVKKYQEYEKYPPVIRDLAIVVDEKKLYAEIVKTIINFHKYIIRVELFDVYQGEKLGVNKKNLAFHLTYQTDKTMTSGEVDKIQASLVKKLEEKFRAKVRDF